MYLVSASRRTVVWAIASVDWDDERVVLHDFARKTRLQKLAGSVSISWIIFWDIVPIIFVGLVGIWSVTVLYAEIMSITGSVLASSPWSPILEGPKLPKTPVHLPLPSIIAIFVISAPRRSYAPVRVKEIDKPLHSLAELVSPFLPWVEDYWRPPPCSSSLRILVAGG